MLRISKPPAADQFCYPVHADGWEALGWTISSIESPEVESPGAEVPERPGRPNPKPRPAPQEPLQPEPVPEPELDPDPDPESEPELQPKPAPEPEALSGAVDFSAMTKADISAYSALEYGVTLDSSMTKAEMLAEAVRLEAERLDAERLKRARDSEGQFLADDPSTAEVNEAWVVADPEIAPIPTDLLA